MDVKSSGSKARVAVVGLGAIGASVVRELDRGIEGLVLAAVSAQNVAKHRAWLDELTSALGEATSPGSLARTRRASLTR